MPTLVLLSLLQPLELKAAAATAHRFQQLSSVRSISHCGTPMSRTASETASVTTLHSVEPEYQVPAYKGFEDQEDYWRKVFADVPASLDIPTDRPRPAMQPFTGENHQVCVDAQLKRMLTDLSRECDMCLADVLMVAWGAVLSRLSGQNDIVLGMHNNQAGDEDNSMRSSSNVFPVRIDLSGDLNTTQLLKLANERIQAARAHTDVSFEKTTDHAQPPDQRSHAPLCQAAFRWGDGGLSHKAPDTTTVRFELELDLQEEGDGLAGRMRYAADLFDKETIVRHVGYWIAMLEAMTGDIKRPVTN
ncbi:hypothetical protein BGZ54_001299, partial [Gamsiella multidivaricata]